MDNKKTNEQFKLMLLSVNDFFCFMKLSRCQATYNGAFKLEIMSMLHENLHGILGGTQ